MTDVDVVVGSGPAALACVLFAARHRPVTLCAARRVRPPHAVESVPAATLTLLLELGITPEEVDVDHLTRDRVTAWDAGVPTVHTGPACAHLDRAALHDALWRRIAAEPTIAVAARVDPAAARPGWVDASGRRAITALERLRPLTPWTASTVTFPHAGRDVRLHIAAGVDGYAYRLGSARWLTVGWVGPGRPPRDAAALAQRIEAAGAGWLFPDADAPQLDRTVCRPAGLSLPVPSGRAIPIGDASVTRDALAAQGLSIALSDACLAADPVTSSAAMTERAGHAVARHLDHLSAMLGTCRYDDHPVWSAYRSWIVAHQAATRRRDQDVPDHGPSPTQTMRAAIARDLAR